MGVFNENHTKHVNIILCGKVAVFLMFQYMIREVHYNSVMVSDVL